MAPRSGYGDALCQRLPPQVECLNLAKGGRSSGSYRAEGSWAQLLDRLQAAHALSSGHAGVPTWVFLQFGHNDQPGKPGRSTDLATEYPVNLQAYVRDVRKLGATPVLVTPLTRRTFKGGVLENNLLPWVQSMRTVAADQAVALIDLNAISVQAVQAMGQDEADTLAMEPPPPKPAPSTVAAPAAPKDSAAPSTEIQGAAKTTFDRTHLGAKGAALFADMVAAEARKVAGLKAYFSH